MTHRIVADFKCTVGEGPIWHPDHKKLYWTDILEGKLFWYEPSTGQSQLYYEGRIVGVFTLQADSSLLLFMDKGTVAVCDNGQLTRTIVDSIPAEIEQRFNDLTADPEGRVYAGTMPFKNVEKRSGRLYRFNCDGSYSVVLEEVGIPNGMAFSLDRKFFFFIDSLDNIVWKFNYKQETGEISNRQAFLEFDQNEGSADGMTIDSKGNLWIAMAMGWKVVQYGPDGKLKRSIRLPARFVSSLTFGGKDLSQLFVTTGRLPEGEELGSAAGTLISLNPGPIGLPEFRSKIRI